MVVHCWVGHGFTYWVTSPRDVYAASYFLIVYTRLKEHSCLDNFAKRQIPRGSVVRSEPARVLMQYIRRGYCRSGLPVGPGGHLCKATASQLRALPSRVKSAWHSGPTFRNYTVGGSCAFPGRLYVISNYL